MVQGSNSRPKSRSYFEGEQQKSVKNRLVTPLASTMDPQIAKRTISSKFPWSPTSDRLVGLGAGSGRPPEWSTSSKLLQSAGVMSTPNSRADDKAKFKGARRRKAQLHKKRQG